MEVPKVNTHSTAKQAITITDKKVIMVTIRKTNKVRSNHDQALDFVPRRKVLTR